MSVSQKKPNQHLENLIKADGFEKLPYWYQSFIKNLMVLGQQTHATGIYQQADYLRGYLAGLCEGKVLQGTLHLWRLVDQAEAFAISKIMKKAG